MAVETIITKSRIGALAGSIFTNRPLRASRENQLDAEVDTILEHSIGPTAYHRDDEHRRGVVEHFRHSLERMCGLARGAGARIMFIQPASNLRDFTPFKSEHGSGPSVLRWQAAIRAARATRDRHDLEACADRFQEASELDPEYALGLWEAGRAQFEARRFERARESFWRAIDQDICPLRAGRDLQNAIADVAGRNGASVIEFLTLLEDDVERSDGHRIPGDESFLDHVHPTIEVHRRLAWWIIDEMVRLRLLAPAIDREAISRSAMDRVMSQIDSRAHALALVQVIQVLSWAGKNDEALRLTETAEQTHPGLSEVVCCRGRLLEKLGRSDEAYDCFAEAVRRNSDDSVALSRLAFAELGRHRADVAREEFVRAIQFTPEAAPASFRSKLHLGLGISLIELGRWSESVPELEESLRISPADKVTEQLLHAANSRMLMKQSEEQVAPQ